MLNSSMDDSVQLSSSSEDVRILDNEQTNVETPTPTSDANDRSSAKKKRGRISTSDVWSFYEKLGVVSGKERCVCKGCGKTYGCATSVETSHLLRHVGKYTKSEKLRDIREMLGQECSRLNSLKLDHTLVRKTIAEAIVMHDLPYRFCEYSKVRELMKMLNSDVKFFSRNTLVKEIEDIYMIEKMKLKRILCDCKSRICLTSDVWTSITGKGFICLTAHYVDDAWRLNNKILNFCSFPPPHNGQNLSNTVMNFLKDWEIESKIFSITLDNASANISMVYNLKENLRINNSLLCKGEHFHVKCSAHVLNLIVQDGLKVAKDALHEIRASVVYVKSSEGRQIQFQDCVSRCYGVDVKFSLSIDVSTRWNSTYLMLINALKYRQAFHLYSTMDASYVNCPSRNQWDRAQRICLILAPFYDITNLMSGSSYPTSNVFFLLVLRIQILLMKTMHSDDGVLIGMAMSMSEKFAKYWDEYSVILAMASVFDPRCKLAGLESWIEQVDSTFATEKVRKIEACLRKLYIEYNASVTVPATTIAQSGVGTSSQTRPSSSTSYNIPTSMESSTLDLFLKIPSTAKVASSSEIDSYLLEPLMDYQENRNLDILLYWRLHSPRFPTLSRIAADLLCIPITTVASESAFSIGSRVLTKYRSVILPQHVQSIICCRNWLRGFKVEDEEHIDDIGPFGTKLQSETAQDVADD